MVHLSFSYSGQNQSSLRELKKENHFLKDYIHRLNAASSDYQATHLPKSSKKEMEVRHELKFHFEQNEHQFSP